jgi:hypothetical protein
VRPDYAASDIDRKWGERRSAPRDYIFDRPVLLGKMRMGPDLANVGKRAPAEDQNAPAAGASPAAAGASPAPSPAAPAAGTSPAAAAAASPAKSAAPAASPAPSGSPAPAAQNAPPEASALTSLDSEPTTGEPPAYSAAWHHRHLYSPRSITLDTNMPAYRFLYEKRRVSGERSADALNLTGPDAPLDGWEVVPTYEARCLVAYLMAQDQSHPLNEVKSAGAPAASPAASPAPAAAPAK